MMNRLFGLIPCAGIGERAGAGMPKQYREIAGQPMLAYALQAFVDSPGVDATLVVLAPDDAMFATLFSDWDAREAAKPRRVWTAARCGGPTRHDSVLGGLCALSTMGADDEDWVLVHDAARPGITPAMIATLSQAVLEHTGEGAQQGTGGMGKYVGDGGLLALPVADTLKRAVLHRYAHDSAATGVPLASETTAREGLWQAQTPQMFRLGLLRWALEEALERGRKVSDESSAIEALGFKPLLVEGSQRNFKVTYPQDFALAEALLRPA
ncbi:MAG: 2-C-methyl-D-erythritol 4-phosphate cytidylyltransferase [Candidatus Protistobacter heckmanni]|nr:2-C-methyl-D-erythritol 4-phosphate cytidylyltransferase [Candidatus Protistobacter heckmanni]